LAWCNNVLCKPNNVPNRTFFNRLLGSDTKSVRFSIPKQIGITSTFGCLFVKEMEDR